MRKRQRSRRKRRGRAAGAAPAAAGVWTAEKSMAIHQIFLGSSVKNIARTCLTFLCLEQCVLWCLCLEMRHIVGHLKLRHVLRTFRVLNECVLNLWCLQIRHILRHFQDKTCLMQKVS